jgi:3-oxoacyl-[acyl-carrier protein] reductase
VENGLAADPARSVEKGKKEKMTERNAAIVTGASRGIGKGVALELAQLGYDVVVNHFDFTADGKPDKNHADSTKNEIEALGAKCITFRGDISSSTDRETLVELTKKELGRCELLVNNAGVGPRQRLDILETTEESYDWVMSINLKGPFFLTQLIANWMVRQKQQNPERSYRIVNISSISAYTSSPSRGEYCVSKAGVSMVTALFADRLAEFNIGVFEIRPGIIATDMTSVVKEKYDKLIAEGLTPIRRWGLPEDIGKVVGAIVEGKLDFSPGQVINVDGGFHLQRL